MSKYTKKLGSDKNYKRPETTYQENLSADDIAQKLQGYEKVTDIADVPLNTHLRYFLIQKDGSHAFRTGGFLHNKTNPEKYVMLTNGKYTWSVQVDGTTFFKKMSQKDEIKKLQSHYEKQLAEKDKIIDNLKKYIKAKISDVDIKNLDNKKAAHKAEYTVTEQIMPHSTTMKKKQSKTSGSKTSKSKNNSYSARKK